MPWPDDAIWWHVYPLGFTGAFPGGRAAGAARPRRTLAALVPWLDYAVELGCSGLLLGPVFESRSHGYDTTDYFRIDPRLGSLDDFDHLVAEARSRGLRILLDGVFNHVGPGFGRLVTARGDGPGAADAARWFRPVRGEADAAGQPTDFALFEGHADLVVLNHEEPEVSAFVAQVMSHWLDRGIDGWRLDAAYAVPPAFWRPILEQVRASHPDAWFVGEMIHGDYSEYVAESTVDSVTQYELWKAIWSSLNDGNFFELAWALKRHEAYSASFLPLTFVGNHDVTRLASQLADPGHIGHALTVLMTVAGSPSIYYGDEQAFRGDKGHGWGGDDEIRPEFPDSPADLAPMGWPTYRLHQQLLAMRRRHPWLAHARTEAVDLTNTGIALRSGPRRDGARGDSEPGISEIWAMLNIGDEACSFDGAPADLVVEAESENARGSAGASVPPGAWIIGSRCIMGGAPRV